MTQPEPIPPAFRGLPQEAAEELTHRLNQVANDRADVDGRIELRLDEHDLRLARIETVLTEHTATLAEHTVTLAEHTVTLAEHGQMLGRLDSKVTGLEERFTGLEQNVGQILRIVERDHGPAR